MIEVPSTYLYEQHSKVHSKMLHGIPFITKTHRDHLNSLIGR